MQGQAFVPQTCFTDIGHPHQALEYKTLHEWSCYGLQIVPCEFHRFGHIYSNYLQSGILKSFRLGDKTRQRQHLDHQYEDEQQRAKNNLSFAKGLGCGGRAWDELGSDQKAWILRCLDVGVETGLAKHIRDHMRFRAKELRWTQPVVAKRPKHSLGLVSALLL